MPIVVNQTEVRLINFVSFATLSIFGCLKFHQICANLQLRLENSSCNNDVVNISVGTIMGCSFLYPTFILYIAPECNLPISHDP